jgi:hypothetical protein
VSTAVASAQRVYQRQTPSIWQAFGRAIWDALEDIGRRRAARGLRELSQRWAHIDPVLAAQMRAAAESSNHRFEEMQ